ncbi:MAG: HD domain-containing protein [Syntrophaceae bacterium]|nr:HD domain-containing protein [Syntrophaceae bacterium]
MKCPGQDPLFWKPGDVFEIPCPRCGYGVEFLKYDVKRRCRCGHEIVNPKIDFGCAEWCPYGDSCIEGLPEEMKARQKEEKNNRLRERIAQEMKRYFGNDQKRINHALKVAQYAETILKIEGGNPVVVLGAAYLHDIGIKKAEEKYGSASSEDQEKIGPEIAREILTRLNVQRGIVDEICDIIGHHHHPRERETLHFQILYEADWLVNIEEDKLHQKTDKLEEIINSVFRTPTGKRLARELYVHH